MLLSPEEESEVKSALSAPRAQAILRQAESQRVQGVVIELGARVLASAASRGGKLLERLRTEGEVETGGEAWEAVEPEFEAAAERQLEQVARFLHAVRQAAPALQLAVVAEEHPASILNPSRLRMLWQDAGLPEIRYWHDAGRVQTRAALGLESPGDWLDVAAAQICGSTLCDWADGEDLRLPGSGVVDFRLLGEYLPRQAKRVVHVAPVYPSELLPAARDALAAVGLT